jgi:V/A-type H+-transporting ATPase subunit K
MKTRVPLAVGVAAGLAVLFVAAGLLAWFPEVWAAQDAPAPLRLDAQAWGWGFMAAALATGMSAAGAAYAVAKVGSAATGALAEKPELFGRLMILLGLAEGIAIYGIIMAILILNRLE